MNKNNSIVAVYPSHTAAEAAIKKLKESGFDTKKLSIVGRDHPTDDHVVGTYNVGDRSEGVGQDRRPLGWAVGTFFRFCVLLDSRFGADFGGGPVGQFDRWGIGRCCRWGRYKRDWGWFV